MSKGATAQAPAFASFSPLIEKAELGCESESESESEGDWD